MARPINSRQPCVKHFSHSHPLRPCNVKEEEEIVCSGCELDLCGPAYRCSKSTCEFYLHKSCFELPRELEHASHTQHSLILLASPPYNDSKFICNACGEYGTAFTYHCSSCPHKLHVGCALLPKTVKHADHPHLLSLFYSSSMDKGDNKNDATFNCDVCKRDVPKSCWIYYCQDCDYGTDLTCV